MNTQHRLEGNKPLLTVCWEGHMRLRPPSSWSRVPKASMEASQHHPPHVWSSCFPRGKQGSGRVTSTDVVKAPLRPGQKARGKWDVGAPHGISHISSSNPPLGGGHSCNFENDPMENEGANRFSVSAAVDRCLSATQRLPSMGWQRGGPTEHAPTVTQASCWN